MKEMHLTTDLWVVSAKAVFLPKINTWTEEIHFWKQEMPHLQRLVILSALQVQQPEKATLTAIETELQLFIAEKIPGLEQTLQPLRLILERKSLGCQYRKVEQQIEQMRKTYYELKLQILPFLAKFVSTSIW
ncbi:MAG: hypothetical protein ACK4TA_12360 [Saprospiraceae bacterium]